MMDTDVILKEVGHFGRYQISILFLLLFAGSFTTFFSLSFIFTTGELDYRCYIDECDGNATIIDKEWLHYAVPYKNNKPVNCYRYKSINNSLTDENNNKICSPDLFSKNSTITCNNFVFYSEETTIIKDFNFECKENDLKIAAVGTANSIGQFIGLPLSGIISDRYGRRSMLVLAMLLSSLCGIIRSFAVNYEMFLTFEVLDAVVSSGAYSAIFILGIEILAPNKRVLGSSIISSYYTIGEIILSLMAWYLLDWRMYLRALYAPGIIFIFYIWLIPESIRWLIANKKYSKAKEIIEGISQVNKKPLSEELKKQLENMVDDRNEIPNMRRPSIIEKHKGVFKEIMASKIMLIRTAICSFSWMTNAFVFYGLNLSSVSVGGNKYINFILVSIAELPGYALTWIILDRFGRRISLFLALAFSSVSCFAFYFIPEGMILVRLIAFLCGKGAITVSFTVLYVFCSEIFPTKARHSLMGTCSMFGRVGSMMAPLTTGLLTPYVQPTLIFGSAAIIAGLLGLNFPETLNQNLPDTIAEAEVIGKKPKIKEDGS